jgi:hypothetical protein
MLHGLRDLLLNNTFSGVNEIKILNNIEKNKKIYFINFRKQKIKAVLFAAILKG